jgi:ketosteroid isomerase-like protein
MASANLDFVRSLYAAWERGDYSSVEWAHPDIEFVIADGPSPGTWKGLAGMAEGYRDFLSAWEEFRTEVDEYRELDDERVLVLVSYRGRGKTSGLELGQMRQKGAGLFYVRRGKVTRLGLYWVRENALADLGLPSETGSQDSLIDNVEIARRAYEAAIRKPKPDFATVNALFDPAHELHSVMDLEGRTRVGAQGFREWLAEMGDSLESWEVKIEEALPIDDDRVLFVWAGTVTGKRSGAEAGQRGAAVVTVRGRESHSH